MTVENIFCFYCVEVRVVAQAKVDVCFMNMWALNTGFFLKQARPGNARFKMRTVYYEI